MARYVAGLYILITVHGRTVIESDDLKAAKRDGLRDYGRHGFESAHAATMDELLDIKQAGGWIPQFIRPAVEQIERNRKHVSS